MIDRRIPVAGDPFYAAARRNDQDHDQERRCFVCIDGLVYLGELVIGDDGEEVEVIEAVPCRRCGSAR